MFFRKKQIYIEKNPIVFRDGISTFFRYWEMYLLLEDGHCPSRKMVNILLGKVAVFKL